MSHRSLGPTCGRSEPSGPARSRNRLATALILGGASLVLGGVLAAGPHLAPFVASRLYDVPASTPSSLTPAADLLSPNVAPQFLLPLFAEEGVGDLPAPSPTAEVPSPTPAGRSPTTITIPAIGLEAPVVVTTWETVNVGGVEQAVWTVPAMRAAGWHQGSAPLGVPGNTVINGHNAGNGEVFRDLYRLEPGARVILAAGDISFSYEVSEVLLLPEMGQPLEVRQANARYIQPTDDERVTLVTCHPYGSLQNRLIVIARPVGDE